jgi:hypothetical protein
LRRLKKVVRYAMPALNRLLGPKQTVRLVIAAKRWTSGVGPATNPSVDYKLPKELSALVAHHAAKGVTQFPLSARIIELQNKMIANTIAGFFAKTNSLNVVSAAEIEQTVAEFRKVFLCSPFTRNFYGANFPSGLNLFCIARHLMPTTIVESGVYKGQSSYFLASACPRAAVFAFDPSLAEVTYRTPGVVFYASDWMSTEIKYQPGTRDLCFFDDHQNQALRIIQAHERGFRHILFDDSWPIEVAFGCGGPPLPSVDMIVDNRLGLGEVVEWVEGEMKWTYVHNREMSDLCAHARALIRAAYEVPSLYRETGIAPTSAYKFVELN